MKRTQVYIVGAGAIGKALAVFLGRENKEALLVRGSVDDEPESERIITVVDQDNHKYRQKVTTTTFSNLRTINGIVLVATKTFGNPRVAEKLKSIRGDFSIVLLQNGLNIERPFASFDGVYRSVLLSTSQVKADNLVSFKPVKPSPIGIVRGRESELEPIVRHINTPHFPFRAESNISKYVWEKAILNSAFNSICPLLEVDNGVFHRSSEARNLARIVIEECYALSEEYGIGLDRDEIEENLILISNRADGQLISTYEDIRKGRRTEIESLNLEIARLAAEIGKPELVTTTKLLGEMIRIKSKI